MERARISAQNSMASEPSSTASFPAEKLLSVLVHAAHHGSRTIASLSETARRGVIQFKEEGNSRSAMTLADTSAQRVIVSSILGLFPELDIVGEEDETVEVDPRFQKVLRADLLDGYEWTAPPILEGSDADEPAPDAVEMSQLVIYVDPLDGTREFVEGRLGNVQCLIGACYKGQPIMGAIGLPFPTDEENSVEVVFGLVGRGIGRVCTKASSDANGIVNFPLPRLRLYRNDGGAVPLSSGDSSSVRPMVDLADRVLASKGGISRQVVGATGNKLLRIVRGETALSLLHDQTCLWDTAAPTAVLRAIGGRVTDYFGEPLVYGKKELGNKLGVVASAPGGGREHDDVARAMCGDGASLALLKTYGIDRRDDSTAQCVDVARDLDGFPLSVAYLARKMGISEAESYSCPENEAVRGLMSNACRVHLHPSGDTAFYKRVVFERLDHARVKMKTAPHKLTRDVKSYKVETSFLASRACKELIGKTGLRIPKCLDAKLMPKDSNPIESKFSILLEDFAPSHGWSQRWLLQNTEECKVTLTALAKMHAYFWHGASFWDDADAARELEEGVWESAGYIQPKLQTPNQCNEVASGWAARRMNCAKGLEFRSFWDDLGERLQSVAEECGRLAHPLAADGLSKRYEKYRTFTHGDPKQANLLFRQTDELGMEVALVDFQWAGFGLAATDVAHFICAAVHADVLGDGGEERLLRHYHDELKNRLVECGAYGNTGEAEEDFGFANLVDQYETAVLDMCRLVIAYSWTRFEPVDKADGAGRARTMNKNSFNKSAANVVWLMTRCDQILRSRHV